VPSLGRPKEQHGSSIVGTSEVELPAGSESGVPSDEQSSIKSVMSQGMPKEQHSSSVVGTREVELPVVSEEQDKAAVPSDEQCGIESVPS